MYVCLKTDMQLDEGHNTAVSKGMTNLGLKVFILATTIDAFHMLDNHDAPLAFLTEYFVCMCEALGHAVAVN